MELIHPEQLREFEPAVDPGFHALLGYRGSHTGLDRRCGRRPYRRTIEAGGAKEQSRLQHPDHGLAALVGDDALFDVAILQIVDRPGGLTLLEDDLAGLVSCDGLPVAHLGQKSLRVETRSGHRARPLSFLGITGDAEIRRRARGVQPSELLPLSNWVAFRDMP